MDPIGGISPSNPRPGNSVPAQSSQPGMQGISDITPNPYSAPTTETHSIQAPSPVQLPPADAIGEPNKSLKPPKEKSKGKGKKIALIFFLVLLVAGLCAGAYYVGFTTGKSKGKTEADAAYQKAEADRQQQEAESETAAEDTPIEAASGKLALGELKDPKYIDETVSGEIGKQLSASDGLVLKVTGIERNYKSTDTNYKLDPTKELVKVNFVVGNVTKEKTKDLSSFSFRLENSVNAQLTPENVTGYADKFDTLKLTPGAQSIGSIVYAVTKSEKPLKFIREQRYRISGENREVTTRIVVSVDK